MDPAVRVRYAPPLMAMLITLAPVWAIALVLFVLLWLVSAFGSRLRDRLAFTNETAYATSAAVSLLALLLGFTISLAINRYDNRRDLVVEEAAAIFAVWQRLPLIEGPARAELAQLTRRYADQRFEYFTTGIDQDSALRADRSADLTVDRMWRIVRGLSEAETTPLIARMLMDNLTRIDDAAWRREAMARAHVPVIVVDLIVVFSLLTAISLGFSAPPGHRVHPTHLIFFALNAASIMLLLDLDQPRSGLVLVSQRPLIEVAAIMATSQTQVSPDLRAGAIAPAPLPALPAPDAATLPD